MDDVSVGDPRFSKQVVARGAGDPAGVLIDRQLLEVPALEAESFIEEHDADLPVAVDLPVNAFDRHHGAGLSSSAPGSHAHLALIVANHHVPYGDGGLDRFDDGHSVLRWL